VAGQTQHSADVYAAPQQRGQVSPPETMEGELLMGPRYPLFFSLAHPSLTAGALNNRLGAQNRRAFFLPCNSV
jgi:hypothetical protein